MTYYAPLAKKRKRIFEVLLPLPQNHILQGEFFIMQPYLNKTTKHVAEEEYNCEIKEKLQ